MLVSTAASQRDGPGFKSNLGPFCVEFPTVQRHEWGYRSLTGESKVTAGVNASGCLCVSSFYKTEWHNYVWPWVEMPIIVTIVSLNHSALCLYSFQIFFFCGILLIEASVPCLVEGLLSIKTKSTSALFSQSVNI